MDIYTVAGTMFGIAMKAGDALTPPAMGPVRSGTRRPRNQGHRPWHPGTSGTPSAGAGAGGRPLTRAQAGSGAVRPSISAAACPLVRDAP